MTKGFLEIVDTKEKIPVLFNPTEYSLSSGMQYTEKNIPGLNHPIGQYIAGKSRTLNLSLLFDTYLPPELDNPTERGQDVTFYTKKILALMEKDSEGKTVPKVIFSWGSMRFEGILVDIRENYTMFLPNGMPVRAKLDITMKSVSKEPASDGEDETVPKETEIVVVEGDSLSSIAQKSYGSADAWRLIAVRNGILNPLELTPGETLILPPGQS